jgi:hypothetical protein
MVPEAGSNHSSDLVYFKLAGAFMRLCSLGNSLAIVVSLINNQTFRVMNDIENQF